MASLCKFELGGGDVDLQMVSGYNSAESEEQYAVHIRGLRSLGQLQEFLGI